MRVCVCAQRPTFLSVTCCRPPFPTEGLAFLHPHSFLFEGLGELLLPRHTWEEGTALRKRTCWGGRQSSGSAPRGAAPLRSASQAPSCSTTTSLYHFSRLKIRRYLFCSVLLRRTAVYDSILFCELFRPTRSHPAVCGWWPCMAMQLWSC